MAVRVWCEMTGRRGLRREGGGINHTVGVAGRPRTGRELSNACVDIVPPPLSNDQAM